MLALPKGQQLPASILAPVLKFDMAYDLEPNFDIVYVEYSTDVGQTWKVLGNINSQPNWYNSDRTNESSGTDDDCQNCPGAQWTGTNTTLTEYSYDFLANAALGEPDLTLEGNVIFRIVFHSDPAVNEEGVIIDNLVVEGFQDDDDDDNDGVLDINDNCPLIGNANQLDTDGDGIGDACDPDDDNDGIVDTEDNCPLVVNTDQADADSDGIGDVCDADEDNDGVPNTSDLCPGTPLGTVVDSDGCPVFSLPSDNFRVQTTGESCRESNNGSILIEASAELNYTATLSGNGLALANAFTRTTTFENLAAGPYEVCITVEGESGYQSCFNLEVSEPEALSVSGKINTLSSEIKLDLSGGTSYTITLNGRSFETTASQVTLSLNKPVNELSVQTELSCQGVYKQQIAVTENPIALPNPIENGDLEVFIPATDNEKVHIRLFSIDGSSVWNKKMKVANGKIVINMDGFAPGVYLLNAQHSSQLYTFKIIKR